MRYVKNTMGIAEKQALEVAGMTLNAQATEQEVQAAKLDYIAMMTDVDLSEIQMDDEEDAFHEE